MADISDSMATNAAGPKSASADGVNVQQHSLLDQIEADKYALAKAAAHADPRKAFARFQIVSPGAI